MIFLRAVWPLFLASSPLQKIEKSKNIDMKFNPNNPVVRLCMQGMQVEDNNRPAEAKELFMQAWQTAANEFEKFIAAYYLARHQDNTPDRLTWYMHSRHDGSQPPIPQRFDSLFQCVKKINEQTKTT
jgi:rifampin ADP-ribosylating transferase